MELHEYAIKELKQEIDRRNKTSVELVVKTVCNHFEINKESLDISFRGSDKIVEVKHTIYYILFKYNKMNYSEIGRCFGKEHSSIMYGVKCIEKGVLGSELYKDLIKLLVRRSRVI